MNVASVGTPAPVRPTVSASAPEAAEGPETATNNDHDADDVGASVAAAPAAKAPAAPGTDTLIDKMA